MHYLHPHAAEIQYVQNEYNTCVFSSMDSDLFVAN